MKVLIATDFFLYKTDGKYFLNETTYKTIERYKKAFGTVNICTRIVIQRKVNPNLCDASELIDSVVPIGSLMECLMHKRDKDINLGLSDIDLVIARVPSIISYRVAKLAMKLKKPVFSVVMGCAWDAYWNHSFKGKLIAPYMYFSLKKLVRKSNFVLYVTKRFLQNRYPTSSMNIGLSDVYITEYDKKVLQARIKKIQNTNFNNIELITIGDVENKCKGMQFVIKSLPILQSKGINVHYTIIGGGNPRRLESLAKKYGVSEKVIFTGRLKSYQLLRLIDNSDIYIQPSLQEGLPRSVVEAMSRACPCIGTITGGIPELIDSKYVIKRKSPQAIANAVLNLINVNEMTIQANLNFERTSAYLENLLNSERMIFYKKIQEFVYESMKV